MYTSAKPYFYGTGRRKKSVARVRLYPGTGVFTINGKTADEYFGLDTLKLFINQPFGHHRPRRRHLRAGRRDPSRHRPCARPRRRSQQAPAQEGRSPDA